MFPNLIAQNRYSPKWINYYQPRSFGDKVVNICLLASFLDLHVQASHYFKIVYFPLLEEAHEHMFLFRLYVVVSGGPHRVQHVILSPILARLR